MAITVIFTPRSMNAAQYDEVIQRLEMAGAGAPPGRIYHACFGSESNMRVVDVWESPESFGIFGQTLMPILHELGLDPGQPDIAEVHNIITG
jgi:hypothetical protein